MQHERLGHSWHGRRSQTAGQYQGFASDYQQELHTTLSTFSASHTLPPASLPSGKITAGSRTVIRMLSLPTPDRQLFCLDDIQHTLDCFPYLHTAAIAQHHLLCLSVPALFMENTTYYGLSAVIGTTQTPSGLRYAAFERPQRTQRVVGGRSNFLLIARSFLAASSI